MTRAVVYARVSQDRSGEAVNVGEQAKRCRARCADRGWTVAATFEDNNLSAWKRGGKRPAFDALMADVLAGRVDVLVVDRLDRLTRDPGDDWAVQAALADAGAVLEVVSGAGSLDPSKVDDRMMAGMNALVGWRESAEKAVRLRAKEHTKAQNGDPHGRRGFGHNHDRSAIIPAEAEVVGEAAARIIAGEDVSSIVRDFNARGVKTAPRMMVARTLPDGTTEEKLTTAGCPCDECEAERKRKGEPDLLAGGPWYPGSLRRLLRQPRLMGARVHNGTVTAATAFVPVIDPDTCERMQAIIKARVSATPQRRPRSRLLTGLLTCGREGCGHRLQAGYGSRGRDGRPLARYACPPVAQGGCGRTSTYSRNVEPLVVEEVFAYLASPEFATALELDRASTNDVDVAEVADDLRNARARLRELGDAYGDELIDLPTYQRQTSRIGERIARLEAQLETVSPAAPTVGLDADDLRARWEHLSLDERRAVLDAVIDRVVVLPPPARGGSFDPARIDVHWRWEDEG